MKCGQCQHTALVYRLSTVRTSCFVHAGLARGANVTTATPAAKTWHLRGTSAMATPTPNLRSMPGGPESYALDTILACDKPEALIGCWAHPRISSLWSTTPSHCASWRYEHARHLRTCRSDNAHVTPQHLCARTCAANCFANTTGQGRAPMAYLAMSQAPFPDGPWDPCEPHCALQSDSSRKP